MTRHPYVLPEDSKGSAGAGYSKDRLIGESIEVSYLCSSISGSGVKIRDISQSSVIDLIIQSSQLGIDICCHISEVVLCGVEDRSFQLVDITREGGVCYCQEFIRTSEALAEVGGQTGILDAHHIVYHICETGRRSEGVLEVSTGVVRCSH